MRAAVINKYGPSSVFKIIDMDVPKFQPNEVLIKTAASSVNPIDWKIRKGSLKFLLPLRFPAILGFDVCGEIIEMGADITKFKKGDWVFGRSNKNSGEAYSEYIALSEDVITSKPLHIDPQEAAGLPLAGMTALQALRDYGAVKKGSRVLIIGAAGGVGMFAVQIAKALGANVTAVCSTKALELVAQLNPDTIINYETSTIPSDAQYDFIFDAVSKQDFDNVKNNLTEKGIYAGTIPSFNSILSLITNKLRAKKSFFVMLKNNVDDLVYLTNLMKQNQLKTHIDSVFDLDNISQGHLKSEAGHAHGKIIITI